MKTSSNTCIVFFYVGASKQLAMVVEGESLINDGTAIVFYNVFVKLATSEEGLTGMETVMTFTIK